MLLPILLLPLVAATPLQQQNYSISLESGTLKNVQVRDNTVSEVDLSNMGICRIEKNALDNVLNLRVLSLANNSLTSLPEFMFSNLTNLEELNLAQNKLRSLKNMFVRLEKLRLLNISSNPLMHIQRGDLFGLTSSATILTDKNHFGRISMGAFVNAFLKKKDELKQLKEMIAEADLEQKVLTKGMKLDETIDPDAMLVIPPRIKPYLGVTRLKVCIPDGMLLSVEPLEDGTNVAEGSSCLEMPMKEKEHKLILRGLNIKGFISNWYQMQYLTITQVDLSYNSITEITKELLNDLPEGLVYVDLSGNKISRIRSQVIENRNLQMLNLQDNLVSEIEEAALQKTNVSILFLSGNRLSDLSFVSSLPSMMQLLTLHKNVITSIPDGVFSNLPRLLLLNLNSNNITVLRNNAFKGLESLRALLMMRNNLMEIEPLAFSNLEQLNDLYLQQNALSQLQTGTFAELPRLRTLALAWNKFRKINKDTFAGLPRSLDFLYIGFNEIDNLEAGSFVGVPRFTLSLTGNRSSSIPRGTFDLPTLQDLHLDNNSLTDIDGDSYEGLPDLKRLWLKNNQITRISKGSCINLRNLTILDISGNPFKQLKNGALYGLSPDAGRHLYIYNNQLKKVQAGVFDNV